MLRRAFPPLAACALGCLGACLLLGFMSALSLFPARSNELRASALGDMAFPLTICAVQGDSFESPYLSQTVSLEGVVTADFDQTGKHGFFMQQQDCDTDTDTSDGIYVYLGAVQQQVVSPGDAVMVEGVVQEYYGKTELSSSPLSVTLLSSGNPLPPALELAPPFPLFSALWYFETLEGMRVSLGDARVVGPTDSSGESWAVRSDLGLERVFSDDALGVGEVICVGDGGAYRFDPPVKTGDQVQGLGGVLDYAFGSYCVQLLDQPVITPTLPALPPPLPTPPVGVLTLTLASLNLHNLFDTADDPLTDDVRLTAPAYQRRLHKHALAIHALLAEPDVIGVQEVENLGVLQDLVSQPELEADYGVVWQDGPDQRGQDVALLYRRDRLRVLEVRARQGCTTLVDGLGPDGSGEVRDPKNGLTCDSDGDGSLDGNRLFSRPPLVVRLELCVPDCLFSAGEAPAGKAFQVIVNHWKSKVEDTPWNAYTLPRRLEQAAFVAELVGEIRASAPEDDLFVVGDLNDFPDSQPLTLLKQAGLLDLVAQVEKSQRYTYNYQGISQVLDYILVFPGRTWMLEGIQVRHYNADYPAGLASLENDPARSSDHDPPLARWVLAGYHLSLPLVFR